MEESPLISIIVPVYKTEKYLDECVNAIVNQSYRNLEIILVEDGSPDNCANICDAWERKDARIIVIHKNNGGVSSARNKGLDIAKGEYICFVDSDDVVSCDYVKELASPFMNENCELTICNAQKGKKEEKYPLYKGQYLYGSLNKDFWTFGVLMYTPWCKLYLHKIITDLHLRFPIGISHGEDQIFNYQYYRYVKKYIYIDKILYSWMIWDNYSLTQQCFSQKVYEDEICTLQAMKKYFDSCEVFNSGVCLNDRVMTLLRKSCQNIKYNVFKIRCADLRHYISYKEKNCSIKRRIGLFCIEHGIVLPIYIWMRYC